jgi:glutathione peroxidase
MQTDLFYDIPLVTIRGSNTTLAPYRGQVLLLVNVASRCGFTPQYAELETLYQDYHSRGFSVLGFPCNQFNEQEPGSDAEIQTFASECFRVTFPLFEKLNVKGNEQSPLYRYIAQHIKKKPWVFIPWNFTKILVDANGRVLRQFLPTTSFKTIRRAIDTLLTASEHSINQDKP